MNEFTFDEFKEIMKNIAHETECPICFNTLKPPCSQCVNGHVVCCECRPKLNSCCPTCQQVLSETKNRVLENVLQLLPRKCKFEGCQEIVKPGNDHELWCGYQPTSCQFRECDWTGTGKTVLEHVKTVHEKFIINTVESFKSSFPITINLSNVPFHGIVVAQLHEYFFFIIYENDAKKHIFDLEVCLVPNGKQNHSFLATFKIGDEEERSFSTSSVLTTNRLKSNKKKRLRSNKKVKLLTLPSSDVQQLIKDKKLPVEYKIEIKK